MKPAFSVLIAAYNAEATIAEALDSLVAQTRGDWEAIIVDDGSADSTATIAAEYAARDARFHVVSTPNGGTGRARNVAARSATADLWCLLDADDLYLPEYFESMARFIEERPGFDIYACDGYLFTTGGTRRPDALQPDREVRSWGADDLLVRNRVRVQTTFRRSVFDMVGGFDEDPRMAMEDWDFWLRAMLQGAGHVHNPERLWMYRIAETQKTHDRLVGARGELLMFEAVIRDQGLTGERLRLAKGSRKRLVREVALLKARRSRANLDHIVSQADARGARAAYLSARLAYRSPMRYLAGMVLMLISPRLFARVRAASRRRAARRRASGA